MGGLRLHYNSPSHKAIFLPQKAKALANELECPIYPGHSRQRKESFSQTERSRITAPELPVIYECAS